MAKFAESFVTFNVAPITRLLKGLDSIAPFILSASKEIMERHLREAVDLAKQNALFRTGRFAQSLDFHTEFQGTRMIGAIGTYRDPSPPVYFRVLEFGTRGPIKVGASGAELMTIPFAFGVDAAGIPRFKSARDASSAYARTAWWDSKKGTPILWGINPGQKPEPLYVGVDQVPQRPALRPIGRALDVAVPRIVAELTENFRRRILAQEG